MKISFGITTHNEGHYLRNLLTKLEQVVESQKEGPNTYEIVIIDDFSTDSITQNILSMATACGHNVVEHSLNDDFAAHKNFLNEQCSGDWILQLDADEEIESELLSYLPSIIESNPIVEAYWFSRINTVYGLTLAHVQKWGWVLSTLEEYIAYQQLHEDEEFYKLLKAYNFIIKEENVNNATFVTYYEPIIMFPDPQLRLYKRDKNIRWEGKVHERITGYKEFSRFPDDVFYTIRHHKDLKRQEQQNAYYETLSR
jgi:glycosyltransferase involved in cell wall biosynthesis